MISAHKNYILEDFNFNLPSHLIAQHPATVRTAARLLDARGGTVTHRVFSELPTLLRAGDVLVFNDTKVLKARLFGNKVSGGQVEILVERVINAATGEVIAHMRASKKPAVGSAIALKNAQGLPAEDGFSAILLGRYPDEHGDLFRLKLFNDVKDDVYTLLQRHGHVPLPPYITHADEVQDAQRYQTVFAQNLGAVAAPTAALHFDQVLLQTLDNMGIMRTHVTLHVGSGTFSPVKVRTLSEHKMHSEWYNIPPSTLTLIQKAKQEGRRIVSVGTTTLRTLESWMATGKTSGETSIFITPGYDIRTADALITNFHLPKSTLMMLVCAFAGYDKVMQLYQEAIVQQYRFFSYGDAMLLQRA